MVHASRRRILLAVSGMSPQIITETLYALAVQRQPAWVPDEIHLITTSQGKQNAVLQLLEDKRRFAQFLRDYNLTHPIEFTESTIHLICNAQGESLPDLRTPEDNEAAADAINEIIRDFCQDPDLELHVSLAGGRKTMGYYAGYALSLFGREHDHLSHVLISEHFESNSEFYYPTPYRKEITLRSGLSLDASAAKVWLAEIPFVRMRDRLPENLLTGKHSFSDTVRLARQATEKVHVTLLPAQRRYKINDVEGKLSPLHMALLVWASTRYIGGQPPIEPVVKGEQRSTDEFLEIAEQYWIELSAKTENALMRQGITQEWLEQNISRLNTAIAKTVGSALAERCKLASRTINRDRGYALPSNLEVEII